MSSNAPSDYHRSAEPIRVPERDTVIPSFYNAVGHDCDIMAVVTENHMPIAVNGEVLTLSMIPPERRFAVGPVQDGSAELLGREAFESAYRLYLEEDLRVKGGRPTFPALWPVPTARDFVSWKVMPHDPSRLVALGIPFVRETPRPTAQKYDPRLDRVIDALERRAAPAEVAAKPPEEPNEEPEADGKRTMTPEQRAAHGRLIKAGREAARARRESKEAAL